jgi:hypothetical protein
MTVEEVAKDPSSSCVAPDLTGFLFALSLFPSESQIKRRLPGLLLIWLNAQ